MYLRGRRGVDVRGSGTRFGEGEATDMIGEVGLVGGAGWQGTGLK